MSEINKIIPNVVNMKEVGTVFEAFADAIRKHPEKALFIGGGLVGLYILKDKKIKFKFKDSEIEFEAE